MPKFKALKIKDDQVFIDDKDLIHLKKSLRKKVGDLITCYDEHFEYECILSDLNNHALKIKNQKKVNWEVDNLHIYLGVIQKNNFEIAAIKLNELNCQSLTPVYFQRSQKNIKINYDRMQKIILESSKQCYRHHDLVIREPISGSKLIDQLRNDEFNFLAYQEVNNYEINLKRNYNNKINLVIGPEGGFTNEELKNLLAIAKPIKLTKTILKSETAAICLASIVLNEMRREDGKK
ncbi:MAG: 16S rRNA (uracil(1498)-N(3))-methyltransferase [Mycoplasmoidaceae bacterium]